MIKIFDGKKEADKILKNLKDVINKENLKPHLAVLLVGDDDPSKMYVDLKKKKAFDVGAELSLYKYNKGIDQKILMDHIEILNNDNDIDGIMVQLPLPDGINVSRVISKIDPKKDIDGFHYKNIEAIKSGKAIIDPVLPKAIFHIMSLAHKHWFDRAKVKALVNSDIFGETIKDFFFLKNVGMEALVVEDYSAEKIAEFTRDADILISICGKAEFIVANMIKSGAIIIDAGTIKKGSKVYGDVNFDSIKNKARFVTPVPGGVGPMTVAMLLDNLVSMSRSNK